ncbi:hypothetical protein ACIP6T_15805 [Pantoea sp. NPDC088449]
MAKPLQQQRFIAMKPALGMQSPGIPPSGTRTVSRGYIPAASC